MPESGHVSRITHHASSQGDNFMTIRLIFNADDYGHNPEISRGIREAHRRGVVTSTTCMMNSATVADDLALALQETPDLGLGVHLVLTWGRPLSPAAVVASLVTAEGAFHKLGPYIDRIDEINLAEAKQEWRAQIEKFIAATGRLPTHLDSHHHSSYYSEGLFRAMLELAQEYGCAIRPATSQGNDDMAGFPPQTAATMREATPRLLAEFAPRAPRAFYASFYDEGTTQEELRRIVHSLPGSGVYEIMCHPGYASPELIAGSVYARQRETELAVLTDPAVRAMLDEQEIELVTFAAV
jgi:predicted glycoside hydrolase/deacetylase ChbG (UPF0249 family)